MPDYVRAALGKFGTEVPAGWAYTLTTVRNEELRTTARFEPSKRGNGGNWIINGRKRCITNAGQAGTYIVRAVD